jgi:hypothetical protein
MRERELSTHTILNASLLGETMDPIPISLFDIIQENAEVIL